MQKPGKTIFWKYIFLLISLFFTLETFAYDFKLNGIYYSKKSSNTVSVTNNLKIYNHYKGNVTIPSHITYKGKKYTVVEIGEGAFFGCEFLYSVKIPSTVKSIEKYAFAECFNLQSIEIGRGVTIIRAWTFFACEKIASVVIPDNVKILEDGIFIQCANLKSVYLSCNLKNIQKDTFQDCPKLKTIKVKRNFIRKYANYAGLKSRSQYIKAI